MSWQADLAIKLGLLLAGGFLTFLWDRWKSRHASLYYTINTQLTVFSS